MRFDKSKFTRFFNDEPLFGKLNHLGLDLNNLPREIEIEGFVYHFVEFINETNIIYETRGGQKLMLSE